MALVVVTTARAQENMKIVVGADFDTYFDNREYSGSEIGESGTFFSSRLTPKVGVKWNDKNSLIFGVDLWSDFGDDTKFFAKTRRPTTVLRAIRCEPTQVSSLVRR